MLLNCWIDSLHKVLQNGTICCALISRCLLKSEKRHWILLFDLLYENKNAKQINHRQIICPSGKINQSIKSGISKNSSWSPSFGQTICRSTCMPTPWRLNSVRSMGQWLNDVRWHDTKWRANDINTTRHKEQCEPTATNKIIQRIPQNFFETLSSYFIQRAWSKTWNKTSKCTSKIS